MTLKFKTFLKKIDCFLQDIFKTLETCFFTFNANFPSSAASSLGIAKNLPLVITRDVEAEAGSGSGGSGPFSVEAEVEAEARKFYRFRFHIGYLT